MLDQPEKIDAKCPFCHGEQVFMVDIIAALNAPLPTLFAIECKTWSNSHPRIFASRFARTIRLGGIQ